MGSGNEAVAKLLLSRDDLYVNQINDDGLAPLLSADEAGNETVVKLLFMRSDIDVISIILPRTRMVGRRCGIWLN